MGNTHGRDIENNGFEKWGRYILLELERQAKCIEDNRKDIHKNAINVAVLQVKSGIWGFLAGLIPGIGALLWFLLKK